MQPATPEALAILTLAILTLALGHSGRLGHRYIGGEHLLLALVSSGQPAGALLAERGVTPQRVEEQIARLAGHGAGAGLFGSLDRDALAAIGIDLGAVRARIESSFEADALAHAGRAAARGTRPARLNLPRPRRDVPAWIIARRHRRRAAVRHEARAQHAQAPGTEHVALAIIAMNDGLVPPILSALGVSAPALRAAILDRCRQAS